MPAINVKSIIKSFFKLLFFFMINCRLLGVFYAL